MATCIRLLTVICFLVSGFVMNGQTLQQRITGVVQNKAATIGVAAFVGDSVFLFNNEEKYPLMSVFKFHVAISVLQKMESAHVDLSTKVKIRSSQMEKNTYSPLREKYPDQDFTISYGELIRYSVSESDNNACDLLIDYVGGVERVNDDINRIGISGCVLRESEKTMHDDLNKCYNNWSTPYAMVCLLKQVYEGNILTGEYKKYLEEVMIRTSTGGDKLKAGLPENIQLGHKTGSSDRISGNVKIGDNDAGVIYLPDGRRCYVAVFIKDSKESDKVNAAIISQIARIVFQYIPK